MTSSSGAMRALRALLSPSFGGKRAKSGCCLDILSEIMVRRVAVGVLAGGGRNSYRLGLNVNFGMVLYGVGWYGLCLLWFRLSFVPFVARYDDRGGRFVPFHLCGRFWWKWSLLFCLSFLSTLFVRCVLLANVFSLASTSGAPFVAGRREWTGMP